MTKVVATDEILKPVLSATGGGGFWLGDKNANTPNQIKVFPRIAMLGGNRKMHGSDWLALQERNAYRVKGVKLIPLLNGVLLLAFLAGLLSLMWYREGR